MALSPLSAFGALLAITGAAHFAAPEKFEQISKVAFPDDTRDWVNRNGATEVAIGLALLVKPTRKLGVLALLGYGGWLGSRVAANSA
jgi:uncharacterized membrane protein